MNILSAYCGLLVLQLGTSVAPPEQQDPLQLQQQMAVRIYADAHPYIDLPETSIRRRIQELRGLRASEDQSTLASILARTGNLLLSQTPRLPNLVAKEEVISEIPMRQFPGPGASLEDIEHLTLSDHWEQFEYIIRRISNANRTLGLSEQRRELKPRRVPAPGPQALGFAGLWTLFVPQFREEARFRYLGTQKIHKVETDVIAFAQTPGKAIPGFIKMDGHNLPMLQQGVAWIERETGHILKIQTELLAPIPEIEMQQLTSSIEFSAVHIAGVHEIFWLPKQVDIRMNWHQRCGGELHRYSGYRLFTATVRIIPE